ncbi:hypothetical protein DSL72_002381 [Monilinia vaccinii-corymbosi]|uniref:Cytochrome P450 n=1 Tax=Monilinia vaccinii-corymbosi TaxID=61207 RepID=A0A8A3PCJ3_9HELO|nr:hypothetical protein DSL72_002381 [Monilinia vaccinii-corymbosi]
MTPLTACIVVAVASSLWLIKYFQTSVLSPLSRIPNAHFSAPYSSLWLFWHRGRKNENKARLAAHEKYGPVVRVAPYELSVNCVEGGVKTIYDGDFEKGEWYTAFMNYGHHLMFSTRENKIHTERKRMIIRVFSNTFVHASETLTGILRTIIYDRYIPQMRTWAENGAPVNIFQENKALFMDLITAYFFGLKSSTNLIENSDERTVLPSFELGLSELFWRLDVPNLTKLMSFFCMSPLPDGMSPACEAMEEFNLSLVNRSSDALQSGEVNDPKYHPVVYAQLRQKLEASKTIPPEQLDTVIAAETLDHIGASHQGTSITVSYLMCEIARRPSIVSRLKKELLLVELDFASSHQIDALPVLDAVPMETLRLHPPSWGPFTRQVPAQGAKIGDYYVPGGTTVASSAYALHRNPNVFPNPVEWNPDRWLDATPEAKKEMMRWFWVFGSGGRMCPGNHLIMRMMKAVLVAVFKEFESVQVPETRMEQVEDFVGCPLNQSVMLAFKRTEPIAS